MRRGLATLLIATASALTIYADTFTFTSNAQIAADNSTYDGHDR